MELVAIIVILSLIQYFYFAMSAGIARGKYEVEDVIGAAARIRSD